MQVTIYDVAKKANVGIGTVSRVINKSPQISPKTREKVLKVIKELKYQPSAMAQRLARKCTNTIACIVPFFTGYFYFELLRGVQQKVSELGYDLILYSVDVFEKKEEIFKKTIHERRADGILIISMTISDKFAKKFLQAKLPVALVDSCHQDLDSITIENKEGAYSATQHLINMGHVNLGMINGSLESVPARIRLHGFKEALADNHIIPDERFILNVSESANADEKQNDGFNKAAGYNAMKRVLESAEPRPTAFFIASDIQAAGAMKAVQEKKLKIPEDIAIVGFDDIELSEYIGLSTMKQPMFEMGKIAIDQLINKIENGSTNGAFKKVLHPTLIIRDSCGAKNNRRVKVTDK